MIVKKIYVCEICKDEHESREKAKECEAYHELNLSIKNKVYAKKGTDNNKGMPKIITIIAPDGKEKTYRYCN